MASVLWEASGHLLLQAPPRKQMKSAADVGSPQMCWCIFWILVSSFTSVRAPDPFHERFTSSHFWSHQRSLCAYLNPYSDYGNNPRLEYSHSNVLFSSISFFPTKKSKSRYFKLTYIVVTLITRIQAVAGWVMLFTLIKTLQPYIISKHFDSVLFGLQADSGVSVHANIITGWFFYHAC